MGTPERLLAVETLAWLNDLGAKEVTFFTADTNDDVSRFMSNLGFRPSTQIAVHRGVPSTAWIAEFPS